MINFTLSLELVDDGDWRPAITFVSGKVGLTAIPDAREVVALGEVSIGKVADRYFDKTFVAYMFSDEPITPARFLEAYLNPELPIVKVSGKTSHSAYEAVTELTGYLWTREELTIGGHDLRKIMMRHQGEYGAIVIRREGREVDELMIEGGLI